MIIEPSNYTYETMPDYTDAVDGAVEIPVTGEEIEIRYAHEVVYDEAHNLHLEIFTPFQMAHPERTWPCITFIQGSAWMKQYVYQKVGMIARLAQRGYVVAIVEYRHSGIAHFPAHNFQLPKSKYTKIAQELFCLHIFLTSTKHLQIKFELVISIHA